MMRFVGLDLRLREARFWSVEADSALRMRIVATAVLNLRGHALEIAQICPVALPASSK